MSLHKLPRGLLEIPKGTNTSRNDNSTFMNNLERTNTLLAQFVSSTDNNKRIIMRQELEESYFNLTMYHLKESVKRKIEQDMWNNLFKKYITDLQIKMKIKDKLESSKAQTEISIFLDESVGFYSKCLDTLRLVYNIRLPGGDGHSFKLATAKTRTPIDRDASEEDIRYIVQHFYVHMGDLSRYHNLTKQSRFYYELAVQLNPASGHAYNQLAILESSSVAHSNISSTNYQHIIRTLLMYEYANSCEIPFPATRINVDSLLRHLNEQSVSTLLTSNNSINEQECMHFLAIAWIHTYANQRMRHNIQRCRQLQQRIIDWSKELIKHVTVCQKNWQDLASIIALQCSLLSSLKDSTDVNESKTWINNMHQFTQDFINAICRGFVSLSHDNKMFEDLLLNNGCAGIVTIFLAWITQFLNDNNQCPMKIPFGEDIVKFLNILLTKANPIDCSNQINLPIQLPELNFLMGFQPLKLPYIVYDIYSDEISVEIVDQADTNHSTTRISFIVSVCKQIAEKWNLTLIFNTTDQKFVAMPLPEVVKKYVKIESSIATRKPVNVALASMKINNTKSNGFIGQNIPSKVIFDDQPVSESTKGVIADVKIARCIQEQIAQGTKSIAVTQSGTPVDITASHIRDENHVIAPAPGLILSSNLPPEYKSMAISSSTPSTIGIAVSEQLSSSSTPNGETSQIISTDQSDHSKYTQATNKNHSYNPNREQFEKDLPPRFANKRTFSQEASLGITTVEPNRNYFDQNKGGFMSMNYWDSINDFTNNQQNQFDNKNLAKKESEILLPPMVPSSWLTEDNPDLKLDTNINNPSTNPYPYGGGNMMHSQQPQQSFSGLSNQPSQNPMNALSKSLNLYKQNQSAALMDHDNQLQFLLKSVNTNATIATPHFRTQTDALMSSPMNFDPMGFMPHQQTNASKMPMKFPSIPPPLQQSMNTQRSVVTNPNLESFQLIRSNLYDKPVFSSSNQAGFSYSSGSTMAAQHQQFQQHLQQHHEQQQQQQQQQHHHVRHNNPLLNLLPGYKNEVHR